MSDLRTHILSHPLFPKNRLPSLYSDFRTLATTNPSGYRANIHAWLTALSSAAAAGLADPTHSRLLLTTSDSLLADLHTPPYGRPLALAAVLHEATREKLLYPLDAFLAAPRSIHHWTYLGAAAGWAWRTLFPAAAPRALPPGRWVVLANVDAVAGTVLQRIAAHPARTDRVYTRALLAAELADLRLSEDDVRVLLRYLQREKQEVAVDGDTLKFRAPGEVLEPVTAEDAAVARLRALRARLRRRCEGLAERVAACTARAKEAVARGDRVSAAAALRERRTVEGALGVQLGARQQVEEVLSAITQAADNVELVEMMERSAGVLKKLNREVGGVERVEGVMDGVREEVDRVREVNEVLAETGVEVDEEEVEDELERMLGEQREAEEREKDAEGLERKLAESLEGLEISGAEKEEKERERVPLEAA